RRRDAISPRIARIVAAGRERKRQDKKVDLGALLSVLPVGRSPATYRSLHTLPFGPEAIVTSVVDRGARVALDVRARRLTSRMNGATMKPREAHQPRPVGSV